MNYWRLSKVLHLNLSIFRLPFSYLKKISPDFAPESPLSWKKIPFAIFNLLFEILPSGLFKRFKDEAIATVQPLSISHYFLEAIILLPHSYVSSFLFLVLNNNHSTKDQHELPPLSPFPIRAEECSESVRNPSDRHTQTPQKPERADESRTQTHRN